MTPELDRVSLTKLEVEVEAEDTREEDEMSSEESNTMPSITCLKYSTFKGDGSQDVDDWLTIVTQTPKQTQNSTSN